MAVTQTIPLRQTLQLRYSPFQEDQSRASLSSLRSGWGAYLGDGGFYEPLFRKGLHHAFIC